MPCEGEFCFATWDADLNVAVGSLWSKTPSVQFCVYPPLPSPLHPYHQGQGKWKQMDVCQASHAVALLVAVSCRCCQPFTQQGWRAVSVQRELSSWIGSTLGLLPLAQIPIGTYPFWWKPYNFFQTNRKEGKEFKFAHIFSFLKCLFDFFFFNFRTRLLFGVRYEECRLLCTPWRYVPRLHGLYSLCAGLMAEWRALRLQCAPLYTIVHTLCLSQK